jgi:uncharacterized protein YlxW (UPF0749 family)
MRPSWFAVRQMINPFVVRRAENSWLLPVSGLALVVGLMMGLAWITDENRAGRLADLGPDQRQRLAEGTLDLSSENRDLRQEVTKLREEKTRLENALSQNDQASKTLNQSLQEIKAFAGLTELVGPGVTVTLRDSTADSQSFMEAAGQIIHDTDVLRVVNELWNAGAEAVSVNGLRVGPKSSFRCVGTVILVDETKIASPVVIRAIGNKETLYGGLTLPGGIVQELKEYDPKMASVEPADKLRIEAFSGATQFKFARLPEDKK